MVTIMINKKLIIGLMIAVLFLSACVSSNRVSNHSSEKGFLEGKISIGPLCPVERFPPDPHCQPTEETFKAWPIAAYQEKTKIASLNPNLDGTYRVELPAGNYVVDLEKSMGIGGGNLPVTITIKAGEITTLNIDIDTGIR